MMSVPETELLYINIGGSEGYMDVTYEYFDIDFNVTVDWMERHFCTVECIEYECLDEPCIQEQDACDYSSCTTDPDTGEDIDCPSNGVEGESCGGCDEWTDYRRHEWDPWKHPNYQTETEGHYYRQHQFTARFVYHYQSSFSKADAAKIVNEALFAVGSYIIPPEQEITTDYRDDSPLQLDTQIGPKIGSNNNDYTKWNFGATKAFNVRSLSLGYLYNEENPDIVDCSWYALRDGPRFQEEAVEKWNEWFTNTIEQFYTQNNDFIITIGQVDYHYTMPYGQNLKTFDGPLRPGGCGGNKAGRSYTCDAPTAERVEADWIDSTNGDQENAFAPRGEKWNDTNHVAISGFKGYDLETPKRNQWFGSGDASAIAHGYTPLSGSVPGRLWVEENVPIVKRLVNGVYPFQPYMFETYLTYIGDFWVKREGERYEEADPFILIPQTPEWENMGHTPTGTTVPELNVQHQYSPSGDPIEPEDTDRVLIQYTAWQPKWGGMQQPTNNHTGNNVGNSPMYYGVNPVIIHNPTGNGFAWVHDVPNGILEDQRIILHGQEGGSQTKGTDYTGVMQTFDWAGGGLVGDLIRHPYSIQQRMPTRAYIDFDFKITIPNYASLEEYWHPLTEPGTGTKTPAISPGINNKPAVADGVWKYWNHGSIPWRFGELDDWASRRNGSLRANHTLEGIVDIADGIPSKWSDYKYRNYPSGEMGWRGKGYIGDAPPRAGERNEDNPYAPYSGQWDISKWINAKFVRFPFDVYYYGATDPATLSPGGSHEWSNVYHPGVGPDGITDSRMGVLPVVASSAGNKLDGYAGGYNSGFFPAGTWILLYDKQYEIKDFEGNLFPPDTFHFRVASHVKDTDFAKIDFITENINARDFTQGMDPQTRGDFNWTYSEWSNNGRREWLYHYDKGGSEYECRPADVVTPPCTLPVAEADDEGHTHHTNGDVYLAAQHATRLEKLIHVVGRIGNVAVDDMSDPRWSSIFWNLTSESAPNTVIGAGVNRFVSSPYNMYDTVQTRFAWGPTPHFFATNAAGAGMGGFIDRFAKLSPWHNAHKTISDSVSYTLPLMRTPVPQYQTQVPLLGYELQYNIQTIGDYDRDGAEMFVSPRHHLVGAWSGTDPGKSEHGIYPGTRWYMYANDPYDPRGSLKMFYDTNLIYGHPDYTRHASVGGWAPVFEHDFQLSLADTRAKINNQDDGSKKRDERKTPSYLKAMTLGVQDQVKHGTPSFSILKQDLRTWIGGYFTYGRTGGEQQWLKVESSPRIEVAPGTANSLHAVFGSDSLRELDAWRNTQKWHGRFNLPRTTLVISHNNLMEAMASGGYIMSNQFLGRDTDRYIATSMTFRTNSQNGMWDLTTFTNTANTGGPTATGYSTWGPYMKAWNEGNSPTYVPGTGVHRRARTWNHEPWSWVRSTPGIIGSRAPLYKSPATGDILRVGADGKLGFPDTTYDMTGTYRIHNYGTDGISVPIAVFNSTSPAISDQVTIGTH